MDSINKIGLIIGILSFLLFIALLEFDRSLFQYFFGFFIFIFPVIFISSFNSNVGIFLLSITVLSYFYFIVYKWQYYDTIFGLVQAVIIGGSIAYYGIEKVSKFDSKNYKNEMKSKTGKDKKKSEDYNPKDYKEQMMKKMKEGQNE